MHNVQSQQNVLARLLVTGQSEEAGSQGRKLPWQVTSHWETGIVLLEECCCLKGITENT